MFRLASKNILAVPKWVDCRRLSGLRARTSFFGKTIDTVAKHASATGTDVGERIKSTYGYVTGSLVVTAASGVTCFNMGVAHALLAADPWMVVGTSLAISMPLLIGTCAVDFHHRPLLKHCLWGGFAVSQGVVLSVLGMVGGPIITQAAVATGCIVGGLSTVAFMSKAGSLQKYQQGLGISLGAVVAASLGNLIYPLPILHSISLYGGLAVFSGLTLTDTEQLLRNASTLPESMYDPIKESLNIYLNVLNIFIRMVEILAKAKKNNN